MTDAEKLKIAFTKARREREAWKNKYQIINKKRKVQEDLFSYGVQSDTPWKLIVDKLVLEKVEMEEQIKKLNLRLLGEYP